ncbi:calcium uptake protein, mitochondrial-like [Rhodamnia argentea]|uniref:Calcium uptake protein, mitochondrial-like n=1 Tax=Rhodamnia argentea TaxID=178133 RepID=A0A8B8QMI1_9MYRT|nr:calcium uptake protein, mitochondrial-like [Rhodamnia argentea]
MLASRSFKRRPPASSPLIRRLSARRFSTQPQPDPSPPPPPPVPIIAAADRRRAGLASGSLLQFLSSIALGSGLGVAYWHCASEGDGLKPFVAFADSSTTPAAESAVDDRRSRSRSLFRKLSFPDYSPKYLFGDEYRRRVFFNYEKRIRLRSPPEKVFEYFASFRTPEGETLMKPADLMRAVVPVFPPSESHLVREGYLIGERNPGELRCAPSEFFMLFDVNNDGLISFKEYIFFVTLLSIPESSFSVAFKMFDIDHSREIDKQEFKKVMSLMRAHNRQGAQHRDGRRTGLKARGSVDDGGLVEYFFGKDGKECLQHDKFVQFMRDLHDEMLNLEFAHYDYKQRGTISAKDFALSMVASADMKHLHRLLDRVDLLDKEPHLTNLRISLEEFKKFADLRKKLQPFSLALFTYGEVNGLLTRKDFQRAASHVCGISLTDNVVELIFHVFDLNQDGNLSAEEFVRVLRRREKDIAKPEGDGLMGLLSCCHQCGNKYTIERVLS